MEQETLGAYLRRKREQRGKAWSQAYLARRAGVSASTVSRLEADKTKSPPMELARAARPVVSRGRAGAVAARWASQWRRCRGDYRLRSPERSRGVGAHRSRPRPLAFATSARSSGLPWTLGWGIRSRRTSCRLPGAHHRRVAALAQLTPRIAARGALPAERRELESRRRRGAVEDRLAVGAGRRAGRRGRIAIIHVLPLERFADSAARLGSAPGSPGNVQLSRG
jgi:transcriptional regulator with XRE-family HTH domain